MPPTYDFRCTECEGVQVNFCKYDDRDLPQVCESCGSETAIRAYLTPPQVRTDKLSRTFVAGQRNDGLSEEIKAAELDAEAMNHDHRGEKYKELKAEAKARRLLNNNKKLAGAIKAKTKLSKKKDD